MFEKTKITDGSKFKRNLQGLYDFYFNQWGKVQYWIKQFGMEHPFANKQDIQLIVQALQVVIFTFAHHFILLLISHIFMFGGRKWLWWLHWKLHYT